MKKLLLIGVFLFVLLACSPAPDFAAQESRAVQVPEEINYAIGVGLAAILAAGAAYVAQKTGLDLGPHTAPVAITLSAWVVAELQNVINTLPESLDPTLDFVFKLIVYLLGAAGTLVLVKKRGVGDQRQGALPQDEASQDRLL